MVYAVSSTGLFWCSYVRACVHHFTCTTTGEGPGPTFIDLRNKMCKQRSLPKCHQHSGGNCATNILELAIFRANITTRRKPLLNTNVDLYRRGKKKKRNYKLKFTTPGFPTFTAQSNHQPALCDLCPFPPGGFELHRGHASGFHTAQIAPLGRYVRQYVPFSPN